MRSVKRFYTIPELATAMGMSRWAVRRWLDAHRIPYDQPARPNARRGSRIRVLLSDIRTFAPKYLASLQEDCDFEFEEAS